MQLVMCQSGMMRLTMIHFFCVRVGPYEAAYRFLKALRPLEPEMWISLSSKKISWSESRTKKFTVPIRSSIESEAHKNYSKRKRVEDGLSFTRWLRKYDEKGQTA